MATNLIGFTDSNDMVRVRIDSHNEAPVTDAQKEAFIDQVVTVLAGQTTITEDDAQTYFARVTLANGKYARFEISATIYATDGTAIQIVAAKLIVAAVAVADVVYTAIQPASAGIGSTGTLSATFNSTSFGTGYADIGLAAAASITETTFYVKWSVHALETDDDNIAFSAL